MGELGDGMRREEVRLIEGRAIEAWPALDTIEYDGWLLRIGAGYTRRSNSVNPLGRSTLPVSDKVRHCEETYRAQGLPAMFKLHPAAEPWDLDRCLEADGYESIGRSYVQTLDLTAARLPAIDPQIKVSTRLPDGWLDSYLSLSGIDPCHRLAMERLLGAIQPAACFMSLEEGGTSSAVGLGVLDRGFVGLFDIVTGAERRNQGLGGRLVSNLIRWGGANGAHTAYLQVMRDNEPALHLYERLGFRTGYQYWYRARTGS